MDQKNRTAEQKAAAAHLKKTEGEKALAEYRAREEAVNKNTERLRALRLARDAENPPPQPKKTATKAGTKAKADAPKASLAEYLKREDASGRKT